jgi:hypothetical protein
VQVNDPDVLSGNWSWGGRPRWTAPVPRPPQPPQGTLILLDTNAVIWALAGDARADTLFASGRRPRLAL